MSDDQFLCPRRAETVGMDPNSGPFRVPKHDTWEPGHGLVKQPRGCSWCGSMNPDDFMAAVRAGTQIGPTDKNYKVYVGDHDGKFYFQHLSEDQAREFYELHRDRKINIGYPGHFYVLPYFIGRPGAAQ